MAFYHVKPGIHCVVLFLMLFFLGGPALAQGMREVTELPRDCTSLLPPSTKGTLQEWQVFVWLEHCDRMKRLRRLSDNLPPDQKPRFYEGIVPASRLPAEYGTNLPVLRVVFPERSFFDTGRDALRPEAHAIVSLIAEALRREPPDVAMFVAGHTDRRGSDTFNEALAIDRADAIAQAIFNEGVMSSSIWRIGFGEDMPLYGGESMVDLALNRRVEFLFSAKTEAVATWLSDQQFGELCQSPSSTASAACKERLRFRDDYIAEKVDHTPRARPKVQPASKPIVRLSRKPERPGAAIAPGTTERASIIPRGATKIRIDPINRRPVRLDL